VVSARKGRPWGRERKNYVLSAATEREEPTWSDQAELATKTGAERYVLWKEGTSPQLTALIQFMKLSALRLVPSKQIMPGLPAEREMFRL
jgi:hypothetical protein